MDTVQKILYKDIIDLHESFHPVYLLDKESPGQWKRFIPNEKFYELLNKVIDTLNGEIPKKSFWLQGTYGVGKSHATSVVKHLLWDTLSEIEDYIDKLEDIPLKEKLKKFREKNKVIPIVIKGVSDVTNHKTFKFVLQKDIKEQFKELGINLNIDSEFDTWIKQISEGMINIEKVLNHPKISLYVDSKEDILNKLKDKDIKILETLEEVASDYRFLPITDDIGEWIKDVYNFIKENNYATHLVVYWDEFTSILELENSNPILNELQKIAELSKDYDVYLYLISHRKPSQSKIKKEDYEHVLDRFYEIDYTINPVTSYHLIKSAIKIKDKNKFQGLIEKYVTRDVEKVIGTILWHIDNQNIEKELKGIFPIHPYTGYILTFIAKNVGSADRTIFTFLYDDEIGFKRFIKEHPKGEDDVFLTVDYLWDYFEDNFKNLEENISRNVLTVYSSNKEKLENQGDKYSSVFKTILLLNILKTYGKDIKLLSPTVTNIKNIYAGVIKEDEIEDILSYIDEERIIYKSPENEFNIQLSAPLDSKELEEIKKEIQKYYDNSKSIVKEVEFQIPLKDKIQSLLRKRLFKLYVESSNIRESELRNNFDRIREEKPYELKIIYFPIFKTEEETPLKELLFKISKEYTSFICIIGKTPFEKNEYEKFVQYLTLSNFNNKHNNFSEAMKNREFAEKIILNWLENHKVNSYIIFKEKEKSFNGETLNEIDKEIYEYGLENTPVKNENLWAIKTPKKIIKTVLFAKDLDDFISEIGKNAKNKELLELFKIEQDYFIDNKFEELKDIYKNNTHPVIKIYEDFNKKIKEKEKKEDFNLDEIIKKYKYIPYGYYPNDIHATVLSFLLRPLIGKLYNLEGNLLEEKEFQDFLENSLNKNKWDSYSEFRVTFKAFSENREKLAEILSSIFSIENSKFLEKVIEQIKKEIKEKSIYLLLLKDNLEDSLKEGIDIISKLLKTNTKEIPPKEIKDYSSILNDKKETLQKKISKDCNALLEQVMDEELTEILVSQNCNLSEEDKKKIIEAVKEKIRESNPLDIDRNQIKDYIEVLVDYKCKETLKPPGGSKNGEHSDSDLLSPENIDILIDNYREDIKAILKEIVNKCPEVKDWLKNRLKSER